MRTVTMLEFRKDAENIIRQVQRGQSMVLLYSGRPAIPLEPVRDEADGEDPFYALRQHAVKGESLRNKDMDRLIYGA